MSVPVDGIQLQTASKKISFDSYLGEVSSFSEDKTQQGLNTNVEHFLWEEDHICRFDLQIQAFDVCRKRLPEWLSILAIRFISICLSILRKTIISDY